MLVVNEWRLYDVAGWPPWWGGVITQRQISVPPLLVVTTTPPPESFLLSVGIVLWVQTSKICKIYVVCTQTIVLLFHSPCFVACSGAIRRYTAAAWVLLCALLPMFCLLTSLHVKLTLAHDWPIVKHMCPHLFVVHTSVRGMTDIKTPLDTRPRLVGTRIVFLGK